MIDSVIADAEGILKSQITAHFQIEKYLWLTDNVRRIDVAHDKDGFQKKYNGFWNVRCNSDWRREYYAYFESVKDKSPTFEQIITDLNTRLTGRLEPSFSSKLLATIDPNRPVWDSRVLRILFDSIPAIGLWERNKTLDAAVNVYDDICTWYEEFMLTLEARRCIEIFDSYLSEYMNKISTVKKIDYLLWGMR